MSEQEKFHGALLRLNEFVIQNENKTALHDLDFELMKDEIKKLYSSLNEWQLHSESKDEKIIPPEKSDHQSTKVNSADRTPVEDSLKTTSAYDLSSSQKKEESQSNVQTKKTISELVAEKSNRVATLNDRFNPGPEISDRVKSMPIRDLKTYIGLNRRAFFADAFFKGDEEKMDELIEHVSYMKNLDEAIAFIKSAADFSHASATDAWHEFTQLLRRRFALAR
jgi:hypothetical protein